MAMAEPGAALGSVAASWHVMAPTKPRWHRIGRPRLPGALADPPSTLVGSAARVDRYVSTSALKLNPHAAIAALRATTEAGSALGRPELASHGSDPGSHLDRRPNRHERVISLHSVSERCGSCGLAMLALCALRRSTCMLLGRNRCCAWDCSCLEACRGAHKAVVTTSEQIRAARPVGPTARRRAVFWLLSNGR